VPVGGFTGYRIGPVAARTAGGLNPRDETPGGGQGLDPVRAGKRGPVGRPVQSSRMLRWSLLSMSPRSCWVMRPNRRDDAAGTAAVGSPLNPRASRWLKISRDSRPGRANAQPSCRVPLPEDDIDDGVSRQRDRTRRPRIGDLRSLRGRAGREDHTRSKDDQNQASHPLEGCSPRRAGASVGRRSRGCGALPTIDGGGA
jgi:hypothetical protein